MLPYGQWADIVRLGAPGHRRLWQASGVRHSQPEMTGMSAEGGEFPTTPYRGDASHRSPRTSTRPWSRSTRPPRGTRNLVRAVQETRTLARAIRDRV